MTPIESVASVLARSFLAGEQDIEQIVARAGAVLGRPWRWLRPAAARYLERFAGKVRPRHSEVASFIRHEAQFERVSAKFPHKIALKQWLTGSQVMQPVAAAKTWNVPVIESAGALADWLWLETGDVDWFADLKALEYKQAVAKLRHYRYKVLLKRSGSVRLIEAPKRRLKKVQREILAGILEKIPAHPAAYGFVKGRSIKTFVAPHVGKRVVLRMDLQDFFASISGARVQTIFRVMGYPESVADLFGGICTNAVPRDIWKNPGVEIGPAELQDARVLYSRPHLPQGAPTSPVLANICAFRIDCRLTGLAKAAGAEYTRYADDLAFSSKAAFDKHVENFSAHVGAVLIEEGFKINHRKTRVMRQGVRQHLAGLMVNEKVNVPRANFDRLKATLTNCARFGPENQNRKAHPAFRSHLEGRIGFVAMVNPEKARRLRVIFDRINW